MAYLGNSPANRFVAPKAATRLSGNGSTVAFTLEHAVGSDEDILVSVDGVIQEPSIAYSVSSGTTLTFTAAPSSGTNNIFVYYLFRTVGTVSHPSNNALSATSGTFTGNVIIPNAGNIGSASDTDAMAISSGGVVNFTQTPTLSDKSLTNTPAFLAKMSGDQDIPDATDTKVTFDTEVYDTDGKYDHSTNYRFTPGVAGTYFFYTQVHMLGQDNSQLVDTFIFIKKNGAKFYAARVNPSNNYTNQHTLSLSVTDVANTTDYYEVFVYLDDITSTGDIDATTSRGDLSFFGAYKLAGI